MEGGLWGETEGVGREESALPVLVHLHSVLAQPVRDEEAGRRVERGDDTEEEMESEEEVEGDSCLFDSTDLLSSVLRTAAKSDGFFKHQQVGEADLNEVEKQKIVTDLLNSKPSVFLQRFGKFLRLVAMSIPAVLTQLVRLLLYG